MPQEPALTLAALRSSSVLVVGDVMLDAYMYGSVPRAPSPRALVPRVDIDQEVACPGGAANVAANVAALGASAILLGLSGEDQAAETLKRLMREAGVVARLVRVAGARTIIKLRIVTCDQPVTRLDFEAAFPLWDRAALVTDFEACLSSVGAVIVSDYAKGTLCDVERLIALARAAGKPIIVDPKGTDFSRYRGATVVSPNFAEFQAVVGVCDSEADIEARAIRLRDALGLQALLVTRAEKGLSLFSRGRPPLHLTSQARKVADATGAGDTVVATLGAALASGFPLEEAATLANVAAGLVVGKPGTATVRASDLCGFLLGVYEPLSRGVCSEPQLLKQVAESRRRGERIVMTNGCFDLLHPGHVDYLEKARALGDRLIVAVNDDDSVRRLKGAQRPLNRLADRMRMLAALSSVDWVVPFPEDTPERLYSLVLPDILVKGGDYRAEDIAGARQVIAAGGQVQTLGFLQGHSTTVLIERIRSYD